MTKTLMFAFAFFTFFLISSTSAQASHSWGNYHWARTSNPFTVKLGDNLTSTWDSYLNTTASDWRVSSVLDTTIVSGQTSPKNCKPTSGRVEVCNSNYGKNGWLGIAQVWVSGSHITQAVTKMNDTYFKTAHYNTPAWKNLVLCQEVGHAFGLDHQDEDFGNGPLGTCMDYSSDPTLNQHPNAHDYEQLETIYAHLDLFTTLQNIVPEKGAQNLDNPSEWGKLASEQGKVARYERDLGQGRKLFTFIIWADGEGHGPNHHDE